MRLRSQKALYVVTKNDINLTNKLERYLHQPVDTGLMKVFEESTDEFKIEKRYAQEQAAHFIFRYLVRNNLQLAKGETQTRNVLCLAGSNPELAPLSYIRRGLIDNVVLFEKEVNTFLKAKKKLFKAITLWNEISIPFWEKTQKKGVLYLNNYLNHEPAEKYSGFILDYCGNIKNYKEVANYIIKHAIRTSPFFLDITILDARLGDHALYEIEFERIFAKHKIRVLAKDSFGYSGGRKEDPSSIPMQTMVWVLMDKSLDSKSYVKANGYFESISCNQKAIPSLLLSLIKKHKALNLEELNKLINFSPTRISGSIGKLKQMGLVEKNKVNKWQLVP